MDGGTWSTGADTASTVPGVWSVSHQDLSSLAAAAAEVATRDPRDVGALDPVTEVMFYWTQPANSAFVTGNFTNWEVTLPMSQMETKEGSTVWVTSRGLAPGDYQYKCEWDRWLLLRFLPLDEFRLFWILTFSD